MRLPFGRDPTVQGDHADDLQAVVVERGLEVGHRAAALEKLRDLVVPGLDRLVPGPPGDLDLFEEGGRSDRAGVQAIGEVVHASSPPKGPVSWYRGRATSGKYTIPASSAR